VFGGSVRRLLADQHPDSLGCRWNSSLTAGTRAVPGRRLHIARLPRRARGAQIHHQRARWLPASPRICPCPSRILTDRGTCLRLPVFLGRGAPTCRACPRPQAISLDATPVRGRLAVPGALHVPAPADAPANPFRVGRWPSAPDSLRRILPCSPSGQPRITPSGTRCCWWDSALATPRLRRPAGAAALRSAPATSCERPGRGVSDFGDITAGDPPPTCGGLMLAPARLPTPSSGRLPRGRRRRRPGRRRLRAAGQRVGPELR